jgi:hypothetical protein
MLSKHVMELANSCYADAATRRAYDARTGAPGAHRGAQFDGGPTNRNNDAALHELPWVFKTGTAV